MQEKFNAIIQQHLPTYQAIRHQLHTIPELAFAEQKTRALLEQELNKLGYVCETGIATTGMVSELKTGKPGPVVALRADMDALPITEQANRSYQSTHEGRMHACGHDGHMATMLCTAAVLAACREDLVGTIKFIWQPAEETGSGALQMIKEGVLSGVDCILGQHNWPDLPPGHIGIKSHCMLGGIHTFALHIQGRGGHSSMPEKCIDPLRIACELKQQLEKLPDAVLEHDPSATLTITQCHAGSADNVIDDTAILSGSYRFSALDSHDKLTVHIQQISDQLAAQYQATIELRVRFYAPPTINDVEVTEQVKQAAIEHLGKEQVSVFEKHLPITEDFAYFLQEIPGCYFVTGNGSPEHQLHTPNYDFNHELMANAVQVFCQATYRLLKK